METVNLCPICDSQLFDPFLVCEDYLVTQEKFAIQQCHRCKFRLTNPRPDAQSIGTYYKSDQYISHNDESKGLINSLYRLVRMYTLRSKVSLINSLQGGVGKILDVGCGTGAFLESCQLNGWETSGMEPDIDARNIAIEKLHTRIYSDIGSLTHTEQFDIITLWHVLEHIPDLREILQQLHKLVTNKGSVLIAVPNSNSYDAAYFKQYWAAYDVPRHLHHFTPDTIELLFKKYGFTLVDKKPMVFDAYYIAMLSARHQGKSNYAESMRVGWKSNTEARRTGDFSSLTYVFKKAN